MTTKNSVPTIHVSNPDLSSDSGVLQAIEVDTSSGEIDMKEDHYENNSKKLAMRHSLRSDDISVSEDDSENLDDTSSQVSSFFFLSFRITIEHCHLVCLKTI